MTPETIGRYTIDSEIGRGGMATVYKAHDPRFERTVAIKVLPREFLHDPEFRARFEREARTIAALEHSAIVPVYDYGEQDGQLYLVMRYMPGGSLADRLRQGPMPIDEAAEVIKRIGSALDSAHQQGIIHRDLKPGNILLDQHGDAYLADFGIAHLSSAATALTVSGRLVGTPAYMSPEQVYGDKALDGRSDIYAIGIILYQMLTGEMPYRADTPAKVMMQHVMDPVPNILADKPDLPVACERVIKKALAKERDERYATATDMALELRQATRSHSRPDWLPPDAEEPSLPPASTHPTPDNAPTLDTPGPRSTTPKEIAGTSSVPVMAPTEIPQWVLLVGGLIGLAIIGAIIVFAINAGSSFFAGRTTDTPEVQATAVLEDTPIAATAVVQVAADLQTATAIAESRLTIAAEANQTATAGSETAATPTAAATATPAVDDEATAQAAAILTRRAEAEGSNPTPTADLIATRLAAEAAATANAIPSGFAPTFGPNSGAIAHELDDRAESVFAEVNLRDVAVNVTFVNPFANGGWDMGITFRQLDANDEYRLVVVADGYWSLNNRLGSSDNFVQEGDVSQLLNLEENGTNQITLLAAGDVGLFLLNNSFVARLDLSERDAFGDVAVSTGYYVDSEREGANTGYQNFAVWSLAPSFGPSSGELEHEPNDLVKGVSSGQDVLNFIVDTTFVNPFAPEEALWDYGYAFRQTEINDQFWLVVRGDGSWLFRDRVTGEETELDNGEVEGLAVADNGRNRLTLIAWNNQGYVFLNDTFVAELDLSSRLLSGDVQAITAFFADSEIEGEATGYEDFAVWPLP
ncbi:MAG: serine/threonine protein kinase [Ardenticatenaceae bacterium]|nr:serine/threonine protein kinase [Ardenticatenaceae bacterium]